MYHRDGHINYVKDQQIVGRMFGGLDIIYKDRQTLVLYINAGAQRRLLPDRTRGTGGAAAALLCRI